MLAGLPNEYKPLILGIKNNGSKITVDYVKQLLLQDVYFDREKNSSESVLLAKSKKKNKEKNQLSAIIVEEGIFAINVPRSKIKRNMTKKRKSCSALTVSGRSQP